MEAVDNKLAVIDQSIIELCPFLMRVGGKEARGVIQQTADDVDQVKRPCPRTCRLNHPNKESITVRQDLR